MAAGVRQRRTPLARQLDIVMACADAAGVPPHRLERFADLCARERRRIAARAPAPNAPSAAVQVSGRARIIDR